MKRNVFIAMTILSSATVFAAEDNAGKIHFTGEIIEPSCVIIGDGGTNEYKIPLGTYPTSFFSSIRVRSRPCRHYPRRLPIKKRWAT